MLRSIISLLLPLLLVIFSPSTASPVHDLLEKYGLPRGLLPDAVKSYSLSPSGEFTVELTNPCYVHFSFLVYYDTTIKGKLSYGKISDLQGCQAKKLFIWVTITGMVAKPEANEIEFQVGILSKSLSADEFQSVPACKSKVRGCRGAAGVSEGASLAVAEA